MSAENWLGFRAVDEMSEADDFVRRCDGLTAELDELHELRTREAELEAALELAEADVRHLLTERLQLIAERDNLAVELAHVNVLMGRLLAERDELGDELAAARAAAAERDNLASDLADLREAHMVTVGKLATANAAVSRYERAGW